MLARIFAAALAVMFSVPASAQECAPIDQVEQVLTEQYGEIPLITGTAEDGADIFIFVNPKTKSFTILTVVNGCVVDGFGGIEWLRVGRQI